MAALLRLVSMTGLCALAVGCAPQAPPRVSGPISGVTGYPVEDYVLSSGDQKPQHQFAIVEVRPIGADREPIGGGFQTVVHVSMRLRNLGERPLALSRHSLMLDAAATSNRTFRSIAPARLHGHLVAPPHRDEALDLYFALPGDVPPKELEGLRFTWMVESGSDAYMTATPIAQRTDPESNTVSFYVVPGLDPTLFPMDKRVVLPRPEAHRTRVVF